MYPFVLFSFASASSVFVKVFEETDFKGRSESIALNGNSGQHDCKNIDGPGRGIGFQPLNDNILSAMWVVNQGFGQPKDFVVTFYENENCSGKQQSWFSSHSPPANFEVDGLKGLISSVGIFYE